MPTSNRYINICLFLANIVVTSRYLIVQCQKWKHQNNMRKLFKVNNKDKKRTSVASFWGLCKLWTASTHCSDVYIVEFEQVDVGWVNTRFKYLRSSVTLNHKKTIIVLMRVVGTTKFLLQRNRSSGREAT